jgi:hypothetical protein
VVGGRVVVVVVVGGRVVVVVVVGGRVVVVVVGGRVVVVVVVGGRVVVVVVVGGVVVVVVEGAPTRHASIIDSSNSPSIPAHLVASPSHLSSLVVFHMQIEKGVAL